MTTCSMKRRTFLKGALASGTLALAAGAGLLKPIEVLAAAWPNDAFGAKREADAIKALIGSASATPSDAIKIEAPMQVQSRAGVADVPFKVWTDMDGVEMIAIVSENNFNPLITSVNISDAIGYSTHIKMGKTSTVTAYVKAGGKLYKASTTVKVTAGGYGMY